MVNLNFKKKLLIFPGLLILLVTLSSCGFWLFPVQHTVSKTFDVFGTDFKTIYDSSLRAATDAGYDSILQGTLEGDFRAEKGFGIDELTILTFHLDKKQYAGRFRFRVTVKSSRGSEKVIQSYVVAYSKYAMILPRKSHEGVGEYTPAKKPITGGAPIGRKRMRRSPSRRGGE